VVETFLFAGASIVALGRTQLPTHEQRGVVPRVYSGLGG